MAILCDNTRPMQIPRGRYHKTMARRMSLAVVVAVLGVSCQSPSRNSDTVAPQPDAVTTSTTTTVAVVTEIVDGRPDAIPVDAVPDGADVTGRQASNGVARSSAAEFSLAAGDSNTISTTVRSALEATGWEFVGRTYDDTTMQMTFTNDVGTTLTWTLIEGSPLTGTVIVAEP